MQDLKPAQQTAITCLLAEQTIEAAAAAADIAPSTLHRWLKDDVFRAAFRDAQNQLFEHAMGHLQSAAAEAVQTLREVLGNKSAADAVRVSAARTILMMGRSQADRQELEDRVSALEGKKMTVAELIGSMSEEDLMGDTSRGYSNGMTFLRGGEN